MRKLGRIRVLLGGAAVIAMAVIGVTVGGGVGDSDTAVTAGSMTTGETTTITHSGTIAPVVAKPPVKAPPYGSS
jgi:hypothetical protein